MAFHVSAGPPCRCIHLLRYTEQNNKHSAGEDKVRNSDREKEKKRRVH